VSGHNLETNSLPGPVTPALTGDALLQPTHSISKPHWQFQFWLATLGLLALLLRLPGLFTEFWLDEVWSWNLVRYFVKSWTDIFSDTLRMDNNHPLNSLLMYMMGDQSVLAVYRLPSLVAGVGAVAIAARFALRRGLPHAVATAAIVATSYPLILYSSEARGYSPAIFFMLLMIDAMDQFLLDRRLWRCAVFAVAVILGSLAQPTLLIPYGAVFVWSVYILGIEAWGTKNWLVTVRDLACCHAIPVAFLLIYFLGFVLKLKVGGANPTTVGNLVRDTLAFSVGLSDGLSANWPTARIAAVGCLGSLVIVGRAWPRILALLIPGILVLPGLLLIPLAIKGVHTLHPRYLITCSTLILLALGLAIGHVWEGAPWRKAVAAGLLVLFIAANLFQVYRFSTIGRGQYAVVMQYMLDHTAGGRAVTVSSNYDFRIGLMLDFYKPRLPGGSRLQYIERKYLAVLTPDWYVTDTFNQTDEPPSTGQLGNATYMLRQTYPAYGPSGISWDLYERQDR
jgi:hypothetical protein